MIFSLRSRLEKLSDRIGSAFDCIPVIFADGQFFPSANKDDVPVFINHRVNWKPEKKELKESQETK